MFCHLILCFGLYVIDTFKSYDDYKNTSPCYFVILDALLLWLNQIEALSIFNLDNDSLNLDK